MKFSSQRNEQSQSLVTPDGILLAFCQNVHQNNRIESAMNQAKKITYIRAKSLAGEGSLCLLFIEQRADTDPDRRHRRARQRAERDASVLLAEA